MLVLNSGSPRRRELLTAAGISFVLRLNPVPEVQADGESAEAFVRRLAQAKAFDVFGKPRDEADAARMLKQLSGRSHQVITGISLRTPEREVVDVSKTIVYFRTLTEEQIAEYTRSGEPNDKAGAYAIQGRASRYIAGIEGCYHNVVGLPVSLVFAYLTQLSA